LSQAHRRPPRGETRRAAGVALGAPPKGAEMLREIYIGNLANGTTPEDLRLAFEEWDGRGANIAIGASGEPSGYGFVAVDPEQVESAVAAVNGSLIRGRAVTAYEALWRADPDRADAELTAAELPWRDFEAARRSFDGHHKTLEAARQEPSALRADAQPAAEVARDAPGNALPQRWRTALPPPKAVADAAVEGESEVVSAPRRHLNR
jgi:RNA recognition motif